MEIEFTPKALSQLTYWKQTGNETILKRIRILLESISQSPFAGIGKPEPLKHELSGFWSSRINDEHRLVYAVQGDKITVVQCRFHYAK
ncbi:Txe/YoeB family addiction module toxin [Dyadobacter sp. CY261]|uniref:Txe/YoeB family addiction module toxin n=1 Tax=Dyadobacter sp. CY261 TaxID=2907203 RepID=UPI001F4680F8|nr:Txe/YoeB family addiction module toxin [Dyadobacter sp. CY261]MCF0071901.1 Txe/YoeB family addiction module toxin [Dyadobacter sp. CY261]